MTTSTESPQWTCPGCGHQSYLNDWVGDPAERECRHCLSTTTMESVMRAELLREMTSTERDAYAVPGTLLRRMLDEGVVEWPTRLVALVEMARSDALG